MRGHTARIAARTCFAIVLLFGVASGCSRQAGQADEERVRHAYEQYRQSVRTADVAEVRRYVTAEAARDLEGSDAARKLQLVKAMTPETVKITGVEVKGESATVTVEATRDGASMSGTVTLARESGEWKVGGEHWKVSLDMADLPVRPFMSSSTVPAAALVLRGHEGGVTSLVFRRGGTLVSASRDDSSVRVWDPMSGEEVSRLQSSHPTVIACSPDGTAIFIANGDGNIEKCSFQNDQLGQPQTLIPHAGDKMSLSPDGKLLAASGFDKPLTVWSVADGKQVATLNEGKGATALAFSPSGQVLASGGKGNQIHLWTVAKWRADTYTVNKVSADTTVSAFRWSRDARWLASTFMDSSIVVFDALERKEAHNFFVRDASAWDVAFSPDGGLFATGEQDRKVYLWRTSDAKRLGELESHKAAVLCVAFSPDGSTLASGSDDRTIVLWRETSPGVAAVSPAQSPAASSAPSAPAPSPPSSGSENTEIYGAKNRLRNPFGSQGQQAWRTDGEATIERRSNGDSCFVVRYRGSFWQEVPLPADAAGKYAVLLGSVSAEAINPGSIDGLPYLYGYMMSASEEGHILAYLQGDGMRCAASTADTWTAVGGVFKIPPNTGGIRVFLNRASTASGGRADTAARFDDLGLFVFDTESDAAAFLDRYKRDGKYNKGPSGNKYDKTRTWMSSRS